MKQLWVGNGRAVLPGGIAEKGSVLVEDGRIAAINTARPAGVETINAAGGWILPGFVDIHVHGGGGADFMDATPEAIRTAARAHFKHGTTAIVPTTMTSADEVLERTIRCFLQVKREPSFGPELLGLHLEGPFFSSASKGAQPVSAERIPTEEWLERFIALAEGSILRWDEAPELPNTDCFARVMKRHHILASIAHTRADADEAAAAVAEGFSHITHLYSATTSFHKKNGIVHAGVLEVAYLNPAVTIELIADGCHVPREVMLLAYKIKGADRVCLITDAMRAAGTDVKTSVLGPLVGGTPVVIKDDVAQLPDLSFYAGSIGTMDRALRVAHVRYGLPLGEVSKMLSLTPARVIGVADRKGSLEIGKDADVVVMTPDFQIAAVVAASGEIYRA